MAAYGVLAVAALLCQASAQLCNGPTISNIGLPLLQPVQQDTQFSSIVPGLSFNPFITPIPVISTTLVDNSVANSLANTLQLLIVSELLESSLNSPSTPCASPLVSNIVPLYDAIGTIGTRVSPLEGLAPTVEVTSYSPVVDVTTVVTDVVTAAPISPIVPIIEVTEAAIATNLVTEVISPVTTYSQSIYAPVTEVIAPAPVTSTFNNLYGSVVQGQVPLVTEVTSPIAPVPSVDVYTTINDISVVNSPVNPYYVQSPTYITEVTEIVSPVQVSPSIVEIPYSQPLPQSFAPINIGAPVSYISDYYAGYADVVTPVPVTAPFPAEIIFPQSIPAQIRCSFAYSPTNVPYLNMNVEPVSPYNGLVF